MHSLNRQLIRHLFVTILICAINANAAVNLKNGNFYVAFDDITVDQSSGLKLTRHYNSRSGYRGWFGNGWGSDFETRLFVMPDGLVAVHENGNAHITLYGQPNLEVVNSAVDKIVQTMRQKGVVKPQQESALRQQLQDDPLERLKWSERYQMTGPLPALGIRLNGAEYESELDRFAETSDSDLIKHAIITKDRSATLLKLKHAYIAARDDLCGQLVRTKEGFERGTCSDIRFGDQQSFDVQGRLTKLNNEGNWLSLGYGKSTYPERITDEAGKTIQMKWNDQGFVSQVSGIEDGKPVDVIYTYDNRGNSLKTQYSSGQRYVFEYDVRNNMTSIAYVDDTKKRMEYDVNDRVIHITQRDGQEAFFRHEANAQGDNETVYLRKIGGNEREVKRLRYNTKGQLLLDRDARSTLEYEYHSTFGTVTRIHSDDLDCRYEYNSQGKVSHESCLADGVDNYLDYDSDGNITKATLTIPQNLRLRLGGNNVVLLMQYDKQGRFIRMGEMGEAWYVTQSYVNKADERGDMQFNGFPENDPVPRLRFAEKVGLFEKCTRAINQRTRINNGFVMVKE